MLEDLQDLLGIEPSQHIAESNEWQDLQQALQLTDSQKEQLAATQAGWQEEWEALQTVKASLTAMRDNDWLWNESVTTVAQDFLNILHANQVSKFLLWTDHNAQAIDELDMVHATASANAATGPVFAFGTEQGGGGGGSGLAAGGNGEDDK